MCGFLSLVSPPGATVDPATLRALGDTLAHRGPDDDGVWHAGRVGFAFRRLSIFDLSPAGHQPMATDDGQVALVFNGAIYNFRALRDELAALGHRFRSTGDTEVLLRAYLQWGTACVDRLNGMWAFVIHDRRRDVVFGSRDRFGIKPLYTAVTPHGRAFASEIKALRHAGAGAEPDWGRVAEWLAAPESLDQLPSRGRTFFAGIDEVPPATAFEVDAAGRLRTWRYWTLEGRERTEQPDVVERFGALLDDALALQLQADVPVGVSLSGGLDSTTILCGAARLMREPVNAFSFMSAAHDESAYIEATLRQTGARLHVVEGEPLSLLRDLDHLLRVHDEPVHSLSAVIGYQIMRAARMQGVKVMLGGQGADEVLAGYPSFFRDHWASLVYEGDVAGARRDIAEWCAVHGGDAEALLAEAERHCRALRRHRRVPLYSRASRVRHWTGRRRNAWLQPALLRHLPMSDPEAGRTAGLTAMLRRATTQGTLPFYLRLEDRNAMAHGVEGRVPFLDHRLVDLAFSLPRHWLLRGPWNKYVLRQAMHGRAPAIVHQRVDKMGFPHPAREWFRTTLAPQVAEVLASPTGGDLYDVERMRRKLALHRAGTHNYADQLFRVVQLERWLATVVHASQRPATIRESAPVVLPRGAGFRPAVGERESAVTAA